MNRKEIIKLVIEEQSTLVRSLKQSVDRYKTASDLDEESTHDPEDFSQQTQAKDMQLRFEQLLNEAQRGLDFVQKELDIQHEVIEKGCLVETDKNYLFVGLSVPVFIFEHKEVVSFSDQAPVFQSIKGKGKGASVEVGNERLKILSFA